MAIHPRDSNQHRRAGVGAILLVAAMLVGACAGGGSEEEPPADSDEGPPEVGERRFKPAAADGFFGINAIELRAWAVQGRTEVVDRHLGEIEAAGIEFVRANVDWRKIEPRAPAGGSHDFDFAAHDRWVELLARHNLRWNLLGLGVPVPEWAARGEPGASDCGSRSPPARPADFAAFMAELARRYGRDGEFWAEHPELPERPIIDYEVWNAPNHGVYWCPAPDPEAYADLYLETARAIHEVDPRAEVAIGGLGGFRQTDEGAAPFRVEAGEFLADAIAARPALRREIDAVAVHIYDPSPEAALADLARYRRGLESVGLDGVPLVWNETGWFTRGEADSPPTEEDERAEKLRAVTERVARTDCGVVAFAPYTWTTEQRDPGNVEDWYGIADPATGEPYQSALAYRDALARAQGRGPEPPLRGPVEVCGGTAPETGGAG